MAEAVSRIANGTAPHITQSEEGASYEPMLTNNKEASLIKFNELLGAQQLHNFIRGCDKVPGATMLLNGEHVKCYGSSLWRQESFPSDGNKERAAQLNN
jgi:formyltetrahydrofolate dehydrogenase